MKNVSKLGYGWDGQEMLYIHRMGEFIEPKLVPTSYQSMYQTPKVVRVKVLSSRLL